MLPSSLKLHEILAKFLQGCLFIIINSFSTIETLFPIYKQKQRKIMSYNLIYVTGY